MWLPVYLKVWNVVNLARRAAVPEFGLEFRLQAVGAA
jgi:hypothetical protein